MCGEHKNEIYQSVQKPHRPVRVNKLPRVFHRSIGQAIEIFKISGLPNDMVPCLHQCNVYIKRKLLAWRAQKCNLLVSAKTEPTGTGQQTNTCITAPYSASIRNFSKFLGYLSIWYHVCTNAMFILKGSYGCGEHSNEIYLSVQKQHRPVRVNKLPRVFHRSIGEAIEIFKISGLLIDMVPWLHQCNIQIQRKLLVWRPQK